jgi:hypothetical protein
VIELPALRPLKPFTTGLYNKGTDFLPSLVKLAKIGIVLANGEIRLFISDIGGRLSIFKNQYFLSCIIKFFQR